MKELGTLLTLQKHQLKFKEGLQWLLRIGSAHNIGGLHDLEIAQISRFEFL